MQPIAPIRFGKIRTATFENREDCNNERLTAETQKIEANADKLSISIPYGCKIHSVDGPDAHAVLKELGISVNVTAQDTKEAVDEKLDAAIQNRYGGNRQKAWEKISQALVGYTMMAMAKDLPVEEIVIPKA